MNVGEEAPASTTITVKTPGGFEVLLTSRDFDDTELTKKQLSHLLRMDKALTEMKFTPVVKGFGKREAKPVEYVEGRVCPTCGKKLVWAQKRDGSKFVKCETNKYVNGVSSGCPFVDWMDKRSQPIPERQVEEEPDFNY